MSRKIIAGGFKDENGIYAPSPPKPIVETKMEEPSDVSIDKLLERALRSIHGIIRAIEVDVGSGIPQRETIQNLKDVTAMLWDFKKKEQEFLDNLTDEDLQRLDK